METINEALIGALYFSLNPLAWVAAIIFSIRSRKLRSPVIAAVATQTLVAVLLIGLSVLSDKVPPIGDMLVIVLVPGVLSGILVSALVILFTKPRQLKRRVFSPAS